VEIVSTGRGEQRAVALTRDIFLVFMFDSLMSRDILDDHTCA
jgi:hypothetical protein